MCGGRSSMVHYRPQIETNNLYAPIPNRNVRGRRQINAISPPSPCLKYDMSLPLIQWIVPDELKAARVVPLFKKSDKTKVEDYRPVSILAVFPKLFERVVYGQVESYLT